MSSDDQPGRSRPLDVEPPPFAPAPPADDETALARWLRSAVEKGPLFWAPVAGLVVVAVGLAVLGGSAFSGAAVEDEVWSDLILSKSVDEQKRIAEENPTSPAAGWALLRAAQARYDEALLNLPANKDAALPLLNQARDLFQQAEAASPKDSPLRPIAGLGMARCLESRNDLDAAITQYEAVAAGYPDTDDAKFASGRAKALKDPVAVAFYKDFYAFKASSVTLPPLGTSPLPTGEPGLPIGGLDLTPGGPGLPIGTPDLTPRGPAVPGPTSPMPPVLPASPVVSPKASTPGGGEFPAKVFENNPPAAPALAPAPKAASPEPAMPKPETPKVEAPATPEPPKPAAPKVETPATPEPAKPEAPKPPAGELPANPFPDAKAEPKPPAGELPASPFPSGPTP